MERLALLVDPGIAIGEPETDLQRRITHRPRERLAHLPRLHTVQPHDEVPDIADARLTNNNPETPSTM